MAQRVVDDVEDIEPQGLLATPEVKAAKRVETDGNRSTDDAACKHDSATRGPEFINTLTAHERGEVQGEVDENVILRSFASKAEQPEL